MTPSDRDIAATLAELREINAMAATKLAEFPHWRRMAEQQREYWAAQLAEFERREEANA